MTMSRNRIIGLAIVLLVAAIVTAAWPWLWKRVEWAAVGIHQRNVTRELESWEQEVKTIATAEQAKRAEKEVEYIRRYYVPAEGYHSDAETEKRLETQRQRTIDAISSALDDYRLRSASTPATAP
jgi:hypothetical protein